MADRTERLTVTVQGTQDVQRYAAALADAERNLRSLQAAQAKVNTGKANAQDLAAAGVYSAAGAAGAGGVGISDAMAQALKDARDKVTQATKDHADAQKVLNQHAADQNKALSQYIDLAARSTSATDREWAAQQKRNAEIQKATSLYRQLATAGQDVPMLGGGITQPSRLSLLGSGISSASARFLGLAGNAATGFAYAAGAATGIPGAGIAAGTTANTAADLMKALPPGMQAILGLAAAAAAVGLAQSTAEAMERAMDVRLSNAVTLAPGQTQRQLSQSLLNVGANFAVGFDENVTNARALGQIGVGGAGRNGITGAQLPQALNLAYAAASMSGMTNAQGIQMVGDLMVKQGLNVEQAAKALQNYRNAAEAAHVPLQRMFDIMQQMDTQNLPLGANVGQLASLQAQLGMGVNVPSLLGPAMGATGLQAKAMEGMLGMTAAQFHAAQLNPAALFDTIAGKAKGAAGGDQDVLAGLLNIYGMDTSSMNPQQVQALAGLIQNGKPGAARAYYQQFVRTGANAPTMGADQLIAHQAAVAGSAITPLQRATILGQYGALSLLVPPGPAYSPDATVNPRVYALAANAEAALQAALAKDAKSGKNTFADALGRTLLKDYQGGNKVLAAGMGKYGKDYAAASKATRVPMAVLIAQDMAESGFNPNAYNAQSGASGIAQLIPGTAASLGVDPFNPHQAIMGQARYDAALYKAYGNYSDVFAAYNEGPGNFQRYGTAGADQSYLDRIGAILADLQSHGVKVEVNVRVTDAAGRTMPSTQTIRQAATTAPTHSPGQAARGHR